MLQECSIFPGLVTTAIVTRWYTVDRDGRRDGAVMAPPPVMVSLGVVVPFDVVPFDVAALARW